MDANPPAQTPARWQPSNFPPPFIASQLLRHPVPIMSQPPPVRQDDAKEAAEALRQLSADAFSRQGRPAGRTRADRPRAPPRRGRCNLSAFPCSGSYCAAALKVLRGLAPLPRDEIDIYLQVGRGSGSFLTGREAERALRNAHGAGRDRAGRRSCERRRTPRLFKCAPQIQAPDGAAHSGSRPEAVFAAYASHERYHLRTGLKRTGATDVTKQPPPCLGHPLQNEGCSSEDDSEDENSNDLRLSPRSHFEQASSEGTSVKGSADDERSHKERDKVLVWQSQRAVACQVLMDAWCTPLVHCTAAFRHLVTLPGGG